MGIIIMGEYTGIDEGDTVRGTGRIVSVPVGQGLSAGWSMPWASRSTARVPSPLTYRPIERIAPNVVTRKGVDTRCRPASRPSTR